MPRDLVPTLNKPELDMFMAILPDLDALLVNNLGFYGLIEYAIRSAFLAGQTGPAVAQLRKVAQFADSRWDNSDERFRDVAYAALYGCVLVNGQWRPVATR